MNLECTQLSEWLFEYVSGELEEERRVHFEEHVRICTTCHIHVETYRVTVRLTKLLKAPPLPTDVESRLRKRLRDECGGESFA